MVSRRKTPFFDGDGVALAQWISERWLCLRVEALRCLAPPGATGPERVRARIVPGWRLAVDPELPGKPWTQLLARAPRQAAALSVLLQAAAGGDPRPLPAAELRRRSGASRSSLRALAERGLIQAAPCGSNGSRRRRGWPYPRPRCP